MPTKDKDSAAPARAAVTPELKGTLDAGEYAVGQTATLTLYENVPKPAMRLAYEVADDADTAWQQVSQSSDGAVFTGTLAKPGPVTVTARMTRAWDGAVSTAVMTAQVKQPTPPPPQTTTKMGVSMSDESHPDQDSGSVGGLSGAGVDWRSAHGYNRGDIDDSKRYAVETVQWSDSAVWNAGGRANLTAIRASLSSVITARPELERIEYSWGNEVDRHVTDYALFEQNCHDIGLLIDAQFGDKVMFGVSFTGNCFRLPLKGTKKVEPFKPVIRNVCSGPDRFVAANLYPQGRDDAPNATKTPCKDFVDPVLDTLAALGVRNFACWEIGTPISPNYDRPAYMAEIRDYTLDYAKGLGMTVLAMDYWDQDIGIDNRLFHDWPKTAVAWTKP